MSCRGTPSDEVNEKPFSTGHNCLFSISALRSTLSFRVALATALCESRWRSALIISMASVSSSVEHAALVGGDHVLDVDESVVATVHLEHFECLLDEVTEVLLLALRVVDVVAHVQVLGLEQVHDGQDLAVVGHESLANGVTAGDEGLQDVEGRGDDLRVARVQGSCTKIVSLNSAPFKPFIRKVSCQAFQIEHLLLIGMMS